MNQFLNTSLQFPQDFYNETIFIIYFLRSNVSCVTFRILETFDNANLERKGGTYDVTLVLFTVACPISDKWRSYIKRLRSTFVTSKVPILLSEDLEWIKM